MFNRVGAYLLNKKAGKELSVVGNEINAISNSIEGGAKWFVNKVKGKMQKPLPELLQEYDLPLGLFPRDATNYEFNDHTRKLTVFLPSICEVRYKDDSILRFFTTVTGYLEKGKLSEVEGIKTKVVVIFINVSCITTEGPKIHFAVGINRTRNRDAYQAIRDGISADNF